MIQNVHIKLQVWRQQWLSQKAKLRHLKFVQHSKQTTQMHKSHHFCHRSFLCWCIFVRYSSAEIEIIVFSISAMQKSTNKTPTKHFTHSSSCFQPYTHKHILHSLLQLFRSCHKHDILVIFSVPLFRNSQLVLFNQAIKIDNFQVDFAHLVLVPLLSGKTPKVTNKKLHIEVGIELVQ